MKLVPQKGPKKVPVTMRGVLFYLFLGLALALTVSLVVTFLAKSEIGNKLSIVESDLDEMDSLEDKEAQVSLLRRRLSIYQERFSSHGKASQFFSFLEDNIHDSIFFIGLDLSTRDGRAVLAGEAESLKSLHQQTLILNENPSVLNTTLSGVEFNTRGGVDFVITLQLSSDIF